MNMLLISCLNGLLKDFISFLEDLFHILSLFAVEGAENVVSLLREHRTALARYSVIYGYSWLLGLIFHMDVVSKVFQDSSVWSYHKADCLSYIEDIILGEGSPVLTYHPQLVLSLFRNILC